MNSLRIAAVQAPENREDVDSALVYLVGVVANAERQGARLICFPEGFLQGYLTEESAARRVALDLLSPRFAALVARFPKTGPMIVFGMIEVEEDRLFNTALVVKRGVVVGRYRKMHLLDGERAFTAGTETPVFEVDGLRFGINICYDTNFPEAARRIAERGASFIVCPANNMMPRQKAEEHKNAHNSARAARCRETGLWLVSADVTGEGDGRVAWGPTAVLNAEGAVEAQLPLGEPGLLIFDVPRRDSGGLQSCLPA